MRDIAALVGGQYGSEGKGLIAGHIADDYGVHVRVGAANAGHTVYVDDEPFVLQQIPCAAYANPSAKLVVGPGAVISKDILLHEIALNQSWRDGSGLPALDLIIDPRAHVITDGMIEREQESDLADRIGSTSTIAREGIGTTTAARVMRSADCVTVAEVPELDEWRVDSTTDVLERLHHEHKGVLLEGTQGTGLSLTTGQFPYCTSRNTTAVGLAADAGVPGNAVRRVILVCRTYPIRVAGNSGPFWHDSDEIQWSEIDVDSNNERTTVTKKVRRVATFSADQIKTAAWLNGASEIALTFADYVDPSLYGVDGFFSRNELASRSSAVAAFVNTVENATAVPVTMIGTGPASVIDLG